jgi:hypothetical protein
MGRGHEADSVEVESGEVEGREWMGVGLEGMETSSGDHERSEVMRREVEREREGERAREGEGTGPGRAGSEARAYSMRLGSPSASGSARARESVGSGESGKWRWRHEEKEWTPEPPGSREGDHEAGWSGGRFGERMMEKPRGLSLGHGERSS